MEIKESFASAPHTSKNKMGILKRITGIIFTPTEVMRSLNEKPRILFPFLLTAFAQLFLYLIRFPLYEDYIWKMAQVSAEMTKNRFNIEMTPEMIDKTVKSQTIISLVSTPIGSLISWLIFTAILFGLLKIFKGEGKFKQYMSITGYAYVITSLYILISLIVSYFTNDLHLTMPLTSIANLMPDSLKGTFIYGFMKPVDVFSIWYYEVVGIGAAEVSKVRKRWVHIVIWVMHLATFVISGFSEIMAGQFM